MVRRRKLKPKWEAIIPALIILVIIIFLLVKIIGGFLFSGDSRNSLYCESNSIKIVEGLIDSDYTNIETVGDYFAYGESLVLTSTNYDLIGKSNDFVDETFVAKNLCTGKEYSFTTTIELDNFIKYSTLDVGLYILYHQVNGNNVPLKFNNSVNDSFTTVTRDNTHKTVNLIADSNYFSEMGEEYKLKDNIVLLDVKEKAIVDGVYDIIIDPSFNDIGDETYSNDVNAGSDESVLLYQMASEIVSELNNLGFKATMTRQSANDPMLTYGEDSRVGRTMNSGAKYYLGLSLLNGNGEDSGASLIYSSYSSNNFASVVKTALDSSGIIFEGEGVFETEITNTGYDQEIDIREIGGKALQAGTYSSYTKEMNGIFAGLTQGVQGVKFNLGYFNNEADMSNLTTNSTKWSKAIADGVAEYLVPGSTNQAE
ncbi:MAG: hypothetical protein ACK5G7_00775 [Erysipelotrichaceae bacterium]